MHETDDQKENESAQDVADWKPVDAFALRLQADAEEEREEGHGFERKPTPRARPRVLGAVEELLEQR